ncbi:MAG TPA: DUF1611 domain-containing protein [Fimbriimonadaceae bacterium]|nr:DUF1611 domain-containing protein [Fimbriimonadaceae bacterium]
MLDRSQPLAIYMEGATDKDFGKMGFGVLRYSPNPVCCVIDSEYAGRDIAEFGRSPRSAPIVGTIEEAIQGGAEVLVLGIAPPGGLIPPEWLGALDHAVEAGLSLVNGLHDVLAPRYPNLKPGQWIWDVRVEPPGLGTASGLAGKLNNKRVLMLGTDMAIGKMTAGLELQCGLREAGVRAEFVATGQIGITVTGAGIPLDAIRVDFAAGAVEREVCRYPDADVVIVEGQGSYVHPASTSPLPLTRGSCPTHIILCHRAGQTALRRHPEIAIPPLTDFIKLCEDVAEVCGTYPRPRTIGIALNTAHLNDGAEARRAIEQAQIETGLPCTDPVRFGVGPLVKELTP